MVSSTFVLRWTGRLAGFIRAAYAIPPDIRRRLIDIYQQGQGAQP